MNGLLMCLDELVCYACNKCTYRMIEPDLETGFQVWMKYMCTEILIMPTVYQHTTLVIGIACHFSLILTSGI